MNLFDSNDLQICLLNFAQMLRLNKFANLLVKQ